MIEIKGQIACRFSIGPYVDFIDHQDLQDMIFDTKAGNVLPTIELKFVLRTKAILPYLNEGNILNASFGTSSLDMIDMQFRLIGDSLNCNLTIGDHIILRGVYHCPRYSNLTKNREFKDKTSIEVLREIGQSHFPNFITNITKTSDKQTWVQCGETDWEFAKKVWLHSYINDNTFITCAVDTSNFIVKDIRKQLAEEKIWEFSTIKSSSESSNIVHFSQYWTQNNYGVTNQLVGRNEKIYAYNLDTGVVSEQSYKLKNLTVLDSDKLNILVKDVDSYSWYPQAGGENWVKAQNQNIRNLIMFGSFNIYIPFACQYKKFRLLDNAKISLSEDDGRVCGNCFITEIVYQITDKKLLTNVTLSKEAPNGIRGEDLVS